MIRFRISGLASLAALATLLVGGTTAQAAAGVDFNVAGQNLDPAGQVYYNGGSSALVGNLASNYVFNTSTFLTAYLGGSANGNAALAFNTGAFLGTTGGVDNFSSTGSSITVTGTAYSSASLTGQVSTTTALMSGSFTSVTTVTNQAGGAQAVVGTAVLVVLDAGLAAYLGVAVGYTFTGSLSIVLNAGSGGDPTIGSAFDDGASGGNATVTPQVGSGSSGGNVTLSPVPAPSGVVLAACGACFCLLGYGLRRRRMIAAGSIA